MTLNCYLLSNLGGLFVYRKQTLDLALESDEEAYSDEEACSDEDLV